MQYSCQTQIHPLVFYFRYEKMSDMNTACVHYAL